MSDVSNNVRLTQQGKALVTGANGFVGRALCEELVTQGYHVVAISRHPFVCTGTEVIVVPNICQADLRSILTGVELIFHLAGRAHVMNETEPDPEKAFHDTNVVVTETLAKAAVQVGVKRFVYVSSIKVYGDQCGDAVLTEALPPAPDDAYGRSKWQAEQALLAVSGAMETVIIRPPLIYGPGVKANFLNLIKLVDHSIPLPLGGIENQRSMLYIGNLTNALVICATHPNAAGKTYLVSDQADVSTPHLVKFIAQSLGKPSMIVNIPLGFMRLAASLLRKQGVYDRLVQSLRLDSSRISEELDWHPPFTVNEGIKATIHWYKTMKATKSS